MKNKLLLFVVFYQIFAFGQLDTLKIFKSKRLDYSKTTFPKRDGLTYNEYVGETISGYTLANNWRKDSINGGFNKEIYNNPYVSSQGEYIGFDKGNTPDFLKSFYYRKGKRYSGKIIDTLLLSYSRPFTVISYYYLETNYESTKIKMVFKADCLNGLIQGIGILSILDSNEVVSECKFKNGEIIGAVISIGIVSKNNYKTFYSKGSASSKKRFETDKNGYKVVADKPLTFKETYETLCNPYEILKQSKKAKQTYIENLNKPGGLFQNKLLLEPLNIILKYFDKITSQKGVKKYETNFYTVNQYNYINLTIVIAEFNEKNRNNGAYIIECYDSLNRLIMVRYYNVSFNLINNLNHNDYLKFYEKVGNGYNLTTYLYDTNGTITKASIYKGVYDNDIDTMTNYEDFTNDINSISGSKPISIIKP